MAKMNALQIVNQILENIGEVSNLTVLTGLSGIQVTVWDKLVEALQDLTSDQKNKWSFLESLGEVTMTTGNNEYTITALSSGSDMQTEDKESFRSPDAGLPVKYIDPQKFDALFPKGITTDRTGYPEFFTKYAGKIIFDKQASATQNSKAIKFRYWKHPTYYSTASPTGTGDIPEPFDRTLLVAYATLKVLTHLGSDEAAIYKIQVFGNDRDIQGSLDRMIEGYSSPELKSRMTYVW